MGGIRHRKTPYNVAAPLCYATQVTATAQWQKATQRGEEATQQAPPTEADEAASQTPSPKPVEAFAEPTIGSAPAEPTTAPPPAEPATGSAEDQARDTQAVWASPSPGNSKGHRGPAWVSLENMYVSMGVQ